MRGICCQRFCHGSATVFQFIRWQGYSKNPDSFNFYHSNVDLLYVLGQCPVVWPSFQPNVGSTFVAVLRWYTEKFMVCLSNWMVLQHCRCKTLIMVFFTCSNVYFSRNIAYVFAPEHCVNMLERSRPTNCQNISSRADDEQRLAVSYLLQSCCSSIGFSVLPFLLKKWKKKISLASFLKTKK